MGGCQCLRSNNENTSEMAITVKSRSRNKLGESSVDFTHDNSKVDINLTTSFLGKDDKCCFFRTRNKQSEIDKMAKTTIKEADYCVQASQIFDFLNKVRGKPSILLEDLKGLIGNQSEIQTTMNNSCHLITRLPSDHISSSIEYVEGLQSSRNNSKKDFTIMWSEKLARLAVEALAKMNSNGLGFEKVWKETEKKMVKSIGGLVELTEFFIYNNTVPSSLLVSIVVESLERKEDIFNKEYLLGAVSVGKVGDGVIGTLIVLVSKFDHTSTAKVLHSVELDLDDPMFERIQYKDQIREGFVMDTNGHRHVIRFKLNDGSIRDENFFCQKSFVQF